MITISNTEISTWQRCRRKWLLTYFLGYQPATEEVTGNRILGVRVHTALEGYYGYDLDPLTVLHLLYQFEIDASPEFEMDLLTERALASAMVEGYIEWAAETGADAGLKVVATEADITVPLPGVPGVQIRGKLDQVVMNEQTGLLLFHDWKTAASFEKHEILALDPQFRFYSMIQKLASGAEVSRVSGGMLTTLRRVKRSDKSKPPYYQRDEFRYDPVTIDSTLAKVQQIGASIQAAREQLDWIYAPDGGNGDLELLNSVQRALFPPTPIIRDCGWSCPFVTLCPMMDDDSDWVGALVRSGAYTQGDPYSYYADDPLRRVRERLAAQ
jgi:hypothetical protein